MELLYLIIYACTLCFITIRAYSKKNNPIYCAIWTAYSVSGVFCVLCKMYQETLVGTGIYHDYWYDLSDTTWWGYLIIIVCNIIAFKPIKIFDSGHSLVDFGVDDKDKRFFILFSYAYIISSLIFILPSIGNILSVFSITDLGELRSSLYANSENEGSVVVASNIVSNFCFKLCLLTKYLAVFNAYVMIKEKMRPILSSFLLIMVFLLVFINSSATAARGGMLIFIYCSGLVGLCFYKYLSKVNRLRIIATATVFLAIVVIFVAQVTMSRFMSDGGGGNPIIRNICFYLGHGPIEFSKITGCLTDFAYGKTIIGRLISHYIGIPYSWETIAYSIGYPNIGALFVTYLGFLYTDFGIVGCILFTFIWSKITYNMIKKRPNNISTIYFFLYYLSFYTTGVFVVGRLEYAALITTTIIYLIMRVIEKDPNMRKYFTCKIILRG